MVVRIYPTLTSLLGEQAAYEAIAMHPHCDPIRPLMGVFTYTNLWAETIPESVTRD